MSNYENYNEKCKNYDKGRQALGLELYLAFLSSLHKPVNQVHILDAGCGTGNYSVGLLRHGIGKVTMMDASEGMLNFAKTKVSTFDKERVDVLQSSLPDLPFEGATFDAIMINFVLHHLEDESDPSFSQHKRTFKEAGFDKVSCYVPTDETVLTPDMHNDFKGILRKEWRDLVSGFSLCTPEETETMLNEIQAMMDAGTYQDTVDTYEENRKNSGQFTIFVASKR